VSKKTIGLVAKLVVEPLPVKVFLLSALDTVICELSVYHPNNKSFLILRLRLRATSKRTAFPSSGSILIGADGGSGSGATAPTEKPLKA